MGTVIRGKKLQAPEPAPKSPSNEALAVPADPVRLIVGKNAARAAPILAFAPRSVCSAARMSGRRASSSDGNPPGRSGGTIPSGSVMASSNCRDSSGVSGWPINSTRALRSLAACRV